MFMGEMGCWLVVGLMKLYSQYQSRVGAADGYQAVNTTESREEYDDENEAARLAAEERSVLRGWCVIFLALPSICDNCGTTLMNAGLLLVAASIYQMTRGALVLFVGLFSVIFLRRHLHMFQWLSLVGVVMGVACVGLAGAIWPDKKAGLSSGGEEEGAMPETTRAIIGVLLIAGAQIFTATQFVLEEWMLENSTIEPLEVVGWEGIFGFISTIIAMIVLHLTIGSTDAGRYGMFDMTEGWRQVLADRRLAVSSVLIMISIGYVPPFSV